MAQTETYFLTGQTKDTLGVAIPYVQVILKDPRDSSIFHFVNSDVHGDFSTQFDLASEINNVILEARRLGYRTLWLNLDLNHPDNDSLKVALLLTEQEIELSEVVVESSRPIRDTNDTLTFQVDSFIDNTEDVAEDVLRKLPGISVTDAGVIKYKGREIKKILLDGDDLTDTNYQVISKNLSADLLAEVQVLKNYTDNRLFKGLENSDDVALNLMIKEGRKAPLFGDIDVKGGTRQTYHLKSNLLTYTSKIKGLIFTDFNNIGDNAVGSDLNRFNLGNLEYRQFKFASELVSNDPNLPDFLPSDKLLFHKSRYASFNFLMKPTKRISIRNLTSLYANSIDFQVNQSFEYQAPEFTLAVDETAESNTAPRELFSDLKLVAELSGSSELEFRSQLILTSEEQTGRNALNGVSIPDSLDGTNKSYLLELSHSKRFNKNLGMNTRLSYAGNAVSQNYRVSNEKLPFDELVLAQSSEQDNTNLGLTNTIKSKALGFDLSFINGFVLSQSRLSSVLGSGVTSEVFAANGGSLRNRSFYSELIAKRQFKRLELTLGGRYRNEYQRFADKSSSKNLLEPVLGLKAQINDQHRTGVVFTNENRLLQLSNLFTDPVLTNFRMLRSNRLPLNTVRSANTIACYWNYEENVRSFINSNLRIYRTSESPFLGMNAEVTDEGIFLQETVVLSKSKISGLVYDVSKYFPRVSMTFKLGYEWNSTQTSFILNEDFSDVSVSNNQLNASIGSAFQGPVNFGFSLKVDRNNSDIDNRVNSFMVTRTTQKIVFKPIPNFVANLSFEQFGYGSGQSETSSDFHIANVRVQYTPKEDNWVIGVALNNLFDVRSAQIQTIDELSRSVATYRLLPRYLSLRVKFKF